MSRSSWRANGGDGGSSSVGRRRSASGSETGLVRRQEVQLVETARGKNKYPPALSLCCLGVQLTVSLSS